MRFKMVISNFMQKLQVTIFTIILLIAIERAIA